MEQLSRKAYDVLREADVIAGYVTYIKLLGPLVRGKEIIASGMTQELRRVQLAVKKAREGKKVVLVSSGDPGIYGMAGLALEVVTRRRNDGKKIGIEVIPGISALNASAALLGAPLSHDFAAISLSDLLTESRLIEERLRAAAKADFVIAL
ncbi:MAG: precorrin-3B C(17)-methyltransferase, partial [Candidatus Omnitrophota bacterium]|nr:precorrin-3B C(17)-methyltransferase [Candidatus Omnitrophota bacterium]